MKNHWVSSAVMFVVAAAMANVLIGQEYVPGEIIVKFNEQPAAQSMQQVQQILDTDVQWRKLRHAPHAKGMPDQPHPLSYFRIATVDENLDLETLCKTAMTVDGVAFACLNLIPELTYTPNDPMFGNQWALEKIDTEGAWDFTTGNLDIVIGIIDTGCRIGHEDLQQNIWVNDDPINGVDDDNNGFIDDQYGWDFVNNNNSIVDSYGHGTQVSGISAGRIDNGLGVAGIANAMIMTSKWWHFSGSDSTVAESVYYAVDNGAHVLNLSLSCQCPMPITEDAVDFAHARGVVVVVSSGNAGSSSPGYPAAYDSTIAVGAIDINDQRASFSNYGPHLDVMAPSPGILAPSPSGDSLYDPNFGGTSAAAPHVAGLAALMLAMDPNLTPEQIRTAMHENADDFGAVGFDNFYGHGRINVAETIASLAFVLGDVNRDGVVDLLDVAPFVELIGSGQFQVEADVNGDGSVDLLDVAPFIELLGG